MSQKLRIAVVGAGITGITASYLLGKEHAVTLFEKAPHLGGHTNTRTVVEPNGTKRHVDTGFIVCNPVNYPNFYKLLKRWGVALRDSDMSFGFHSERPALSYVGPGVTDFLCTPLNLLRPSFLAMLLERHRFNTLVLGDLRAGRLGSEPLHSYLARHRISDALVQNYLVPFISAIWSSADATSLKFPTATFAMFFNNHGMLELSKRSTWQTVVGGSHAYVQAFQQQFSGRISQEEVQCITRANDRVLISTLNAPNQPFDRVVLATHADEALHLLTDPSAEESKLLGSWRYSENAATLHTDRSLLPRRRTLWASWNYCRSAAAQADSHVTITYYMNRLQGLRSPIDYFVSLNSERSIDPSTVLYSTRYTHPIYTPESVETQNAIRALNGVRNTFFGGAYLGYGFHEDGVRAALDITQHFGVRL